jgi:copper chaperone CopZ
MSHARLPAHHRSLTALAALALFLAASAGAQAPPTTRPALTRVRFQIRSDCSCASCGFALQSHLRKLPGVTRADLSVRERVVAVTFDEERVPLSQVAASVSGCELGKHSALIGDLTPLPGAPPDAVRLTGIPGVRAAQVNAKKGQLLVELADQPPTTTAGLTASLAKVGLPVRFDR